MRRRLEEAALELFAERGYERTTTAEIAARAGVTERTYFRHFPDKREVLFAGEQELRDVTVEALAAVPADVEPLPALRQAFHRVVPLLERNRALAELRAPIIQAAPALREREYAKAAALVDLVGSILEQRGATAYTALLAARVGMDALRVALRGWFADGGDLDAAVDEAFDRLRTLAGELPSRDAARGSPDG
ncbi:TetR family transcriptional regulator [Leifsonia soli]